MADDGYVAWYQARLWQLLPGVYRSLDTPDGAGPLREIVDRIGGELATLRRGMDRLWANQSIETCDDWAIPYIGDLLATRLVSCMDARAQRVDVAKTIYYRRRSGTLGLLEELAADIAGRDARAVEFFRRLGRTRHQFDPAIRLDPPGGPPASAIVEGLIGASSGSPAGGFADLRNRYAAGNSGGPFDEFAHTADLRRGGQSSGWHNISHLGVFIWWLYAHPIAGATPVSNGQPSPCFSFDPSGRRVPLFARSNRNGSGAATGYGEDWLSPDEWDLPGRIRESLWKAYPDALYPVSLAVELGGGAAPAPLPRSDLTVHPERGLFSFTGAPPDGQLVTACHFGFSSRIGAGGFDERILEKLEQPALLATVGGGAGLDAALAAVTQSGTVEIADSLTYPGVAADLTLPPAPTPPAASVVQLRARNAQRPVIRWAGGGATWTITGNGGSLILQGLWLQGADLVLAGRFDTVRLRVMTLDPGTAGQGGPLFDDAIDGMPLAPTTLWIEGTVQTLILERCVTGPVRTRNGGAVETLSATDCIIQGLAGHAIEPSAPILDPAALAEAWKAHSDPTSAAIVATLPQAVLDDLAAYSPGAAPPAGLVAGMATALAGLDRAAMETAYPLALADLALGASSGEVQLARCTVLGRTAAHRLSASECILDEVAQVEDSQHGCVRFSAYADGSRLHAPFRSVRVPARGPVFRSRRFGEPDYARLYRLADAAILGRQAGDSILAGARNESEMGAFALEAISLKRRGLALKYEEYTPLGVYPVWIDAD